jgi:hypothetical protein
VRAKLHIVAARDWQFAEMSTLIGLAVFMIEEQLGREFAKPFVCANVFLQLLACLLCYSISDQRAVAFTFDRPCRG